LEVPGLRSFRDLDDSNCAEFRMNTSSEDTSITAASRGFGRPKAANPIPSPFTASVPMKIGQDHASAPSGNLEDLHEGSKVVSEENDRGALLPDVSP
jgi:hypothetical protein